MQFQISIAPGTHRFTAEEGQTILEAALAAGLLLPYSCRDGVCGACKGRVLEGEVDPGKLMPGALSEEERAEGQVYFCQAKPCSDLHIAVRTVSRADDIPVRKLPARVESLEKPADDVAVLRLKLPASETFRFRAGQYIDILLADGKRRSFSIANAPHDSGFIELHIRHIEGGAFTPKIFAATKVRDIFRFEGPLGSFCVDQTSTHPLIFLAGGTGFAPVKSIIEHLQAKGDTRPMWLYWGARQRAGLYMHETVQQWCTQWPNLHYVPVLSDADGNDGWNGRRGLVHQAVLEDIPDLSGYDVYACGAPAMIQTARTDFTQIGKLPETAFHSDAFTFSSDSQT